MDQFTITTQGRLVLHRREHEPAAASAIGKEEFFGGRQLRHVEDIDMQYHGDIEIYGSTRNDDFAHYVARFTHGQLESIRPFEALSEIHKMWLLAGD